MAAREPLRIVIVGGESGGMSAAVRARRLDESASIVVLEKGPYVSYANSGVPSDLGGEIETDTTLVLQTPSGLKARFNVDVRVDSRVVRIAPDRRTIQVQHIVAGDSYQLPFDKLILSEEAEPYLPPVEGIDSPNVFTLRTIPDLQGIRKYVEDKDCRTAVVIGGGFLGVRAAETLHNFGLRVSIVDAGCQILAPFDQDIAEVLHSELSRQFVALRLQTRVEKIEQVGPSYDVVLSNGTRIAGDIVIAAVDLRARTIVAKEAGLAIGKYGVSVNPFMQTSDADIYAIGDMVETEHRIARQSRRLVLGGPAIKQGRLAVDHIFGKATPYPGNVSTFVVKIFNMTAGITGLSVADLHAVGYSPQWATIHMPDHVGYYPASKQMTLRVAFLPTTGRLLGAQAVGRIGVDKRIDVLSTALQADMSVFDLQQLELSYAPQYGSAKDPVNVAGSVGCNIVCGDVRVIRPGELAAQLDQHQIVDVRPPGDYAHSHILSALSLPLDTLRDKLGALEKGRPIAVYSRVGYHGYIAYRILKQSGYTVMNLDGGFKSVVEGGFGSIVTSPPGLSR